MKFLYAPSVSPDPDSDDFLLILRPEIPITIFGPVGSMAYTGLVDTGSDNTILPLSIAGFLSIPVEPAAGLPAKVFSGERVQLFLGEATFRLSDGEDTVLWRDTVCFFDFKNVADEMVVLGHSGFLDYFTATFDGKAGSLTLVANEDMPAA